MSSMQLRDRQNLEHWCEASSEMGAKFINVLRTCGFNATCLFMRITTHVAFPRGKGEGKDILLP